MKILILSGFLGSGKTSALLPLARYIVGRSRSEKEHKVMILENEVGEIGVDDAFLRSGGLKVDTLFSGCACCSMSGELVASVQRIRSELDPDWLILETTGLAYPKNIQKTLHDVCRLDSRICVLVDAARWKRLHRAMAQLLEDQITGADAVLVNKCDLVDAIALDEIEADIRGFERSAAIARISALAPVAPEVWNTVLGEAEA